MSRKAFTFWSILLPDIGLLFFSLWLTIQFRYQGGLGAHSTQQHFQVFAPLFALWLVVFFIHGLFETGVFRRYTTLIANLFSAMVVNLLVAVAYFYLLPNLNLTPRRFLVLDVVISFALILSWHLLIKYFLKNRLYQPVYLFSFNQELKELEEEIKRHSFLGYRVLGHLNEQGFASAKFEKNTILILPDNLQVNSAMSQELYKLRTRGLVFFNHKDFYENLLRRVYLSQLNEIWFLENINYQEKRFYNFLKRAVDLLAGVFFFALFIVSYPLIMLLIKLDTRGPALFTQKRIGKDGLEFFIYKYRSMSTATDTTWTRPNDSRITRVGKVLRKLRIDELPQSINLLKGDLSLVGPRPEQAGIVETLRKVVPFYDERHLVKPGITGWAQLNIYAGTVEESTLKLQYDLYYIKHRSLVFDLEIILKTIYYIFTWQGR